MKKSTKIGLGIGGLLLGTLLLSGCTNSFCSTVDKAHILYAIDHGVCEYYATEDEAKAASEAGKGNYRMPVCRELHTRFSSRPFRKSKHRADGNYGKTVWRKIIYCFSS